MQFEVSEVIDRPPAVVFDFIAVDHVRNHPRWDPMMQLEQVSEGPIGVGTVIRRRHTHYGDPVEGKMEVLEFEPDRRFGVVILDGPVEMRSQVTFEASGPDRTTITAVIEMPGSDAPMEEMMEAVRGSLRTMKRLIESER